MLCSSKKLYKHRKKRNGIDNWLKELEVFDCQKNFVLKHFRPFFKTNLIIVGTLFRRANMCTRKGRAKQC